MASVPAAGELSAEQDVLHRLADVSIRHPVCPFSTQRGEERRVTSMLGRTAAASEAMLHQQHAQPFVLGQWRRPVAAEHGVRAAMHKSAQQHSKPVGTGLSDAAMRKLYSRQVRQICVIDAMSTQCMGTRVHLYVVILQMAARLGAMLVQHNRAVLTVEMLDARTKRQAHCGKVRVPACNGRVCGACARHFNAKGCKPLLHNAHIQVRTQRLHQESVSKITKL